FPVNRSIHGHPPLLWALEWQKPETARLLVRNGAEVNVRWEGKGTALYLAVLSGSVDLVRDLLARGADPDAADHGRNIPELLSHSATWPAPEMRAVLEHAVGKRDSLRSTAR